MPDNTLTSMTQISVYLPEAPSGAAFKSVIAQCSAGEQASSTGVGNITTRQLQCRLGSAGYTAHTNSNLYTGSGEQLFAFHAVDLTGHFQSNWSGTSMTFDSQVLYDGTNTNLTQWNNVAVTLYVTYEYDDTSSTQVKTVRIPLDAPPGSMSTTKPGSATATIPNLSTELPEAAKTFRSTFITVQGNRNYAATTDATVNMQLDATAAYTANVLEGAANTDYWFRIIWDAPTLDVSASMGFYLWIAGAASKGVHPQVWLTVTYEFDTTAGNDVFVSLLLPMEVNSPMGGTTSADYQRGDREFFIEEPGTVTTKQVAYFVHWDQAANIGGLAMRIGTGSFVAYTDTAATLAGGNGAMCRNDSAFTFTRGRNTLNWDVYRTDATDLGFNVSGFWIVNYTAGKPSTGYGAANHTCFWNLSAYFDGAANVLRTIPAIAPSLPESDRFYSAVGTRYMYTSNTTGSAAGVSVLVERLAGEGTPGGIAWEAAYVDIGYTDPETGLRTTYSQIRTLFKRWANDPDPNRMSLQTARRWRTVLANNCASFDYLDLVFTYHSIPFTVSGAVTGSSGGTVYLGLHRAATGELVDSTTRIGNGAYSFTWYDNTEEVFVEAWESSALIGRSDTGLAV